MDWTCICLSVCHPQRLPCCTGTSPYPVLASTGSNGVTPSLPHRPTLPLWLVISENVTFCVRSDTWRLEIRPYIAHAYTHLCTVILRCLPVSSVVVDQQIFIFTTTSTSSAVVDLPIPRIVLLILTHWNCVMKRVSRHRYTYKPFAEQHSTSS